ELFVNYRYLIADDPHFAGGRITDTSFDDAKHTVTIGLRFDLDPDDEPAYVAPVRLSDARPMAPPPPPPPPLGTPKRFVIFFGFNKANLTIKAQRVVAEAVETAQRDGAASILVTGHTDTVGSAPYNQILSERRAKIVKRELIRLGVAPNSIRTVGKGETE